MQFLNADELEIKRLDRSHEGAVRSLFLEGLADRFMFNGPFNGDPESLLPVALSALDPGVNRFLIGAFHEGEFAGVIPCTVSENGNGKTLEMHIHLAKRFRGRALASGFVRRVASALKSEGYSPFIWGPVAHGVAKTIYLHAGFREVAILPGLWQLEDGTRCDIGVAVWGGA